MNVSIIIVNYNTSALLDLCLDSISEWTKGVSYEVIVVDNASADDSLEMIRKKHGEVVLLASDRNLGFGRANNLGAARASGKYLFFLNADTELRSDAASILASFMDGRNDCGIAGGNLVDPDGRASHSYRLSLPAPRTELQRFAPSWPRIVGGPSWTYNRTGRPMPVAYVTGADLMVPRELFLRLGGFDPDFFMYYEETELTHRARSAGYSVYSVPQARIMHVKGASLEFAEGVRTTVYESKYLYMRKVRGKWAARRAHGYFLFYCSAKRLLLSIAGMGGRAMRYDEMILLAREAYRKVAGLRLPSGCAR